MKKIIITICFVVSLFCYEGRLEKIPNFGKNPAHLRMFVHIPDFMNTRKKYPLLLVLHGSMQTAKKFSRCAGWNKLADSLDFALLYPDKPVWVNPLTSFSFYNRKRVRAGGKETESIMNMVYYALNHYPVHRDSIYITGMSAGGAMVNVLMNEYPGYFRAGALISAPAMLRPQLNLESNKVPPVVIIQGKRDLTVWPINADRLELQWRLKHDCGLGWSDSIPDYQDHKELTFYCVKKEGKTVITRLDVAKTGHMLLIDPGISIERGGKRSLFSKDIDFHSPYWIVNSFGLTK